MWVRIELHINITFEAVRIAHAPKPLLMSICEFCNGLCLRIGICATLVTNGHQCPLAFVTTVSWHWHWWPLWVGIGHQWSQWPLAFVREFCIGIGDHCEFGLIPWDGGYDFGTFKNSFVDLVANSYAMSLPMILECAWIFCNVIR
jgi:hypothetical protein